MAFEFTTDPDEDEEEKPRRKTKAKGSGAGKLAALWVYIVSAIFVGTSLAGFFLYLCLRFYLQTKLGK